MPSAAPEKWERASRRKPSVRFQERSNSSDVTSHAPSQHGRTRTPKQLARNAKNPWKTFGFVADRTGTELLDVFSNVFLRIRKVLKASRWLQDK
jgi:hypothetical protein